MSVQGKECALADRGRNCGLDFCLSVVCEQYFLFVVDTLLLMKSTRWT